MKTRIAILTFLLALSCIQSLSATHVFGQRIYYECLSTCTIRVHVHTYIECPNVFTGIFPVISWRGDSVGCTDPVAIGTWNQQVVFEVSPVCPGIVTKCLGGAGPLPGINEYHLYRDYDVCSSNCNSITGIFASCCRNNTITSGAANQSLYLEFAKIEPGASTCNSPPIPNAPPQFYFCEGQNTSVDLSAYDPEGDSISYKLVSCLSNGAIPVSYNSGYSFFAPLGPDWEVELNAKSGQLSILAKPGGYVVAPLCYIIEEWRNGVLMNVVSNDIQMMSINCSGMTFADSASIGNPFNVTGVFANSQDTIFAVPGTSFCFDISATHPDVSQVIRLGALNGFISHDFYHPLLGNPSEVVGTGVTGRCCVNYTIDDTITLYFGAKADSCQFAPTTYKTVTVIPVCNMVSANMNGSNCQQINFASVPGLSQFGSSFSWTGNGGLSGNPNASDSSLTHTYTNSGTYWYKLELTDTNGCVSVFEDSIYLQPHSVDLIPDSHFSICPAAVAIMQTKDPMSFYNWSTGHSSDTISVSTPGNYFMTGMDLNGCQVFSDTVVLSIDSIEAAMSYTINTVVGNFQGNTTIGTGLIWNWDFGDGTFSKLQNPLHTFSVPGLLEVCLTVENATGCTHTICDSVLVKLIGLDELENELDFKLFPNPNMGSFEFILEREGIANIESIKIVDLLGRELPMRITAINRNRYFVENENLGKGVYILSFNLNDKLYRRSFIIE